MVLSYLNVNVDYRRIVRLLRTNPAFGTPFPNIDRLQQLGVNVQRQQGTIGYLKDEIERRNPCIVPVVTRELPYWSDHTEHAVVVVGVSDTHVVVNDPVMTQPAIHVPIGDFDLAWLERDEQYATLTR